MKDINPGNLYKTEIIIPIVTIKIINEKIKNSKAVKVTKVLGNVLIFDPEKDNKVLLLNNFPISSLTTEAISSAGLGVVCISLYELSNDIKSLE
jgi:ornithine cyclodeaminase/alanine dehydrogenase-like protein (mu-crystallin family)